MKRVDLHKNMLFGETSLEKPESLNAYYKAMLIQRINFLDMHVYTNVCLYVCIYMACAVTDVLVVVPSVGRVASCTQT